MKKAKFALSAIVIFSATAATFAFKAMKFGTKPYYTTDVFSATATRTLQAAVTTGAAFGEYKYYTTLKNNLATNHGTVTAAN